MSETGLECPCASVCVAPELHRRIAELNGRLKNIGEHAERVRCSRGTSIEADESERLLELVAAALREE